MAAKKYDRQDVVNRYLKTKSIQKTSESLGCSTSTVSRILRESNIVPDGGWKCGKKNTENQCPVNVVDAVEKGDKRAMLVAIRDKLAKAIDTCDSDRDLPALTKRFMEVQTELESMPDPEKVKISKHDRMKRRAQRKPGTDH